MLQGRKKKVSKGVCCKCDGKHGKKAKFRKLNFEKNAKLRGAKFDRNAKFGAERRSPAIHNPGVKQRGGLRLTPAPVDSCGHCAQPDTLPSGLVKGPAPVILTQ